MWDRIRDGLRRPRISTLLAFAAGLVAGWLLTPEGRRGVRRGAVKATAGALLLTERAKSAAATLKEDVQDFVAEARAKDEGGTGEELDGDTADLETLEDTDGDGGPAGPGVRPAQAQAGEGGEGDMDPGARRPQSQA
ncbi:MAG: hypothetical protein IMW99_10760 [Firmicutes bacterium]|nr:hypothetical protein [Bacillota bacterium]